MPDEITESGPQPRLSDGAIEYYRGLLTPELEATNPAWFNMLRQTVDRALAVTGQRLEPPADPRSPQQAYWDRATQMDPTVKNNIERDLKSGELQDGAEIKRRVEQTGRSYPETLELAQAAIDREGLGGMATSLSAISLVQAAASTLHRKEQEKRLGGRPA